MQKQETPSQESLEKKEEPTLRKLGTIKRDTRGTAPNGAFEIGPIPPAYRPIFEEGDS